MKLIVITTERILENEAYAINQLFECGLQVLHFRKPHASLGETERILKDIDPSFYPRIVLHDHFQLVEIFDLKGIHINRRNPGIYHKPGISVSCSCHSLDEVVTSRKYDYMFLSPVFDSISKIGYRKGFTTQQLYEAGMKGIINEQVIALGGITPENIPEISQYGFGGIAVLGVLWGDFENDGSVDELLERFNNLKTICEKQ
ncbi:MAG: thiamine phosphate synthase [Tannerella sp.]|nr:thiamine phosphate synthase [Tannerella sp.]